MPLVLAIEPDLRQAAILKRICREKVHADVLVVDSRDAALEGMRSRMPDVILLSALLSPRDEDELIAHLRTLHDAEHLQTYTIPQLASTLADHEPEEKSRGFFAAFRRKKDRGPVSEGCDPDLFADEIRTFLQRAAEKKEEQRVSGRSHEPLLDGRSAARPHVRQDAEPADSSGGPSSSWASPFEWRPATSDPTARPETHEAPEPAAAPNAGDESWIESVPPVEAVPNDAPSDPSGASEPEPPAWQSTESGVAASPAAWDSDLREASEGEAGAPDVAPLDLQSHVAEKPAVEQPATQWASEHSTNESVVDRAVKEPVIEHDAVPVIEQHAAPPVEQPPTAETVVEKPSPVPLVERVAESIIRPAPLDPVIDRQPTEPIIELLPTEPAIDRDQAELPAAESDIEPFTLTGPAAPARSTKVAPVGTPETADAIEAALSMFPDDAITVIDTEDSTFSEAAAPADSADAGWMRLDPDVQTDDQPEPVSLVPQAPAEIAPPARSTKTKEPKRRTRSASAKPTPAPAAVLRLTPLAMWARAEEPAAAREKAAAAEPRSCAEELRDLMSRLAVPPHIAEVGYARGCHIRRVRVPGGRERRRGATPGPVILSKRALQAHRDQSAS